MLKILAQIYLILCLFLLAPISGLGQYCDGDTPTQTVDLTTSSTATWTSPDIQRDGNCCGTSNPDKCVEFVVTLHPDAYGIVFDVCDGAIPPGALFYQVDCGLIGQVGDPLCLTGAGPHHITFCKPGNNTNKYCITSLAAPTPGPDIVLNDGCSGFIYGTGYDESTIQWNSVFPGSKGQYNNLLDCTSGCDTVNITAGPNYPDYVDYEICGQAIGACGGASVCDTIRIDFNPTLGVSIEPSNPVICFGSSATTITAVGTGGTPPYTYTWSTGETGASINVAAGTYTVTMQDNSDCPPVSTNVTVTQFASQITVEAGDDQLLCADANAVFEFDLSGTVQTASGGEWSGGNGTFNVNNTSLNTTYTPTAAEIATGQVKLYLTTTGNGGCPAEVDSLTLFISDFPMQITETVEDISCFGVNDGEINVTVTDNAPPYMYTWGHDAGNMTGTATNLASGNYSVYIVNNVGCDSTINFTINEPTALQISIDNVTDVACFSELTGGVSASVNGGTSAYTYSWNTNPVQNTLNLSNVGAGSYQLSVTDANGCSATEAIVINQPSSALQASISSSADVACFGENSGSATASGTGGTAPYDFLWNTSPNQTSSTINGLVAGDYKVIITDGQGCIDSADITIDEPSELSISASHTDILCFGGTNGTGTANASGGVTPYTYAWDTPDNQTNANATNLAAGAYNVTVTDNNNCSASASITVIEPTELTISIDNITDVACRGDLSGNVTVSLTGGTANYTYSWNTSPIQNTLNLSNVGAGTYQLSVQDAHGCSTSETVVITQPSSALQASISTSKDVACFGESSGSATAMGAGGSAPYSFSWDTSPIQTSATINGLVTGNYEVVITDTQGCKDSANVTIGEPTQLLVSASHTDVSCFEGTNGTGTVSASGGTTPYTYAWNTPNNQSTITATNLSAGQYTATVTDDNNCSASASITVIEPDELVISIDNITDVSCKGDLSGSVVASHTGGTADYIYAWTSTPAQNTLNLNDVAAGTYQLTVLDANGCFDIESVTINEPSTQVQAVISGSVDVACFGDNNGSASVTGVGGTSPYQYEWSTSPTQTTSNATNLIGGDYVVTVTDGLGCQHAASITIGEPTELTASAEHTNVSCFGFADGTGTVNASGGTTPYTYSWNTSDNQTTITATSLAAGQYDVTVTDDNNCSVLSSITVIEPTELIGTVSTQNISCYGDQDGTASAAIQGGTEPYTYAWNTTPLQTTPQALNLNAQTHEIIVTDAHNCSLTLEAVITQPDSLNITPTLQHVTCHNGTDGALTVTLSGGVPDYTYQWSHGPNTPSIQDLMAGTYDFIVEDGNGCTKAATFDIIEPDPIELNLLPTDTACPGARYDLQAEVTPEGFYTFFWFDENNQPLSNSIFPTSDQIVYAYAKDANDCISQLDSIVLTVLEIHPDVLLLEKSKDPCEGDPIELRAGYLADHPGLVYTWENCPECEGLGTFEVSPSETTTYSLTVTDACDNTARREVEVIVHPLPRIDIYPRDTVGCPGLEVTFYNFFDQESYTDYTWIFGDGYAAQQNQITHTFEESGVFDLTVQITDTNGCENEAYYPNLIEILPGPEASFDVNRTETTILDPTVLATNTSPDYTWMEWLNEYGSDSILAIGESMEFTFPYEGTFLLGLSIENNYGCRDTVFKQITVNPMVNIFVPNTITDNGDGRNDVFFPVANGMQEDTYKLQIFDRWGLLVFETTDWNAHWDATRNGIKVQQDVYIYKIQVRDEFGDEHDLVGHVSVLR